MLLPPLLAIDPPAFSMLAASADRFADRAAFVIYASRASDRNWLSAARQLTSLAAFLNAPVEDCLAAAGDLDAAMVEAGASAAARSEVLCAMRNLPHLMAPVAASADARIAERLINAARPALRQGTRPGACALACSLLPTWAASLPFGPHWALQIRVLCHNLLAVLSTFDGDATDPLPAIAALNALVVHCHGSNPGSCRHRARVQV